MGYEWHHIDSYLVSGALERTSLEEREERDWATMDLSLIHI